MGLFSVAALETLPVAAPQSLTVGLRPSILFHDNRKTFSRKHPWRADRALARAQAPSTWTVAVCAHAGALEQCSNDGGGVKQFFHGECLFGWLKERGIEGMRAGPDCQ